ncbi:hypothetical protein TVAG_302610 [Trichomonas vaginalis G3]|uniref:Uncharacterized protein n=1 Tax=Trichomonas vaginalis (strain ATCC PRA-98 / G3) TaxID=412133 RepID=A2EGT6_TRIV3|nr:armadillo (ARM) repeat-containing protein family [Trichomonas vaginalis G3]EAY08174.1 hypothetical protein TVAG_302610 [Trichomonas vaginalis G3]KAI5548694.1 armadillo (ARM) repeat-containing protein family [Trichomonas vaginalis G3]|eukprot:XP_001320397.1 hypothetical protein [Trichomonas vaginalis G3]
MSIIAQHSIRKQEQSELDAIYRNLDEIAELLNSQNYKDVIIHCNYITQIIDNIDEEQDFYLYNENVILDLILTAVNNEDKYIVSVLQAIRSLSTLFNLSFLIKNENIIQIFLELLNTDYKQYMYQILANVFENSEGEDRKKMKEFLVPYVCSICSKNQPTDCELLSLVYTLSRTKIPSPETFCNVLIFFLTSPFSSIDNLIMYSILYQLQKNYFDPSILVNDNTIAFIVKYFQSDDKEIQSVLEVVEFLAGYHKDLFNCYSEILIPRVFGCLDSENDDVVECALDALSNIITANKELIDYFIQSGITEKISTLVTKHSSLKVSALELYINLLTGLSYEVRVEFVKSPLFRMMYENFDNLQLEFRIVFLKQNYHILNRSQTTGDFELIREIFMQDDIYSVIDALLTDENEKIYQISCMIVELLNKD